MVVQNNHGRAQGLSVHLEWNKLRSRSFDKAHVNIRDSRRWSIQLNDLTSKLSRHVARVTASRSYDVHQRIEVLYVKHIRKLCHLVDPFINFWGMEGLRREEEDYW